MLSHSNQRNVYNTSTPCFTNIWLPRKAFALTGIEMYLFHVHVPSKDVFLKKYIIYKERGGSEPAF